MDRKYDARFCQILFAVSSLSLVLNDLYPGVIGSLVASYLSVIILLVWGYAFLWTNLRTILLGFAAFSLCLSIWTTHWPLKTSFNFAKPQLEGLVRRIEQGENISVPQHLTGVTVFKIEARPKGPICFWTWGTSAGYRGFVKSNSSNLRLNTWKTIELEPKWYYVIED